MKLASALFCLALVPAWAGAMGWFGIFQKSDDQPADVRPGAGAGEVSGADRQRGMCLLRAEMQPPPLVALRGETGFSDVRQAREANEKAVRDNVSTLQSYLAAARACRPLLGGKPDGKYLEKLDAAIEQGQRKLQEQLELAKQYPSRA